MFLIILFVYVNVDGCLMTTFSKLLLFSIVKSLYILNVCLIVESPNDTLSRPVVNVHVEFSSEVHGQ